MVRNLFRKTFINTYFSVYEINIQQQQTKCSFNLLYTYICKYYTHCIEREVERVDVGAGLEEVRHGPHLAQDQRGAGVCRRLHRTIPRKI